jgi:hypothetical protein
MAIAPRGAYSPKASAAMATTYKQTGTDGLIDALRLSAMNPSTLSLRVPDTTEHGHLSE